MWTSKQLTTDCRHKQMPASGMANDGVGEGEGVDPRGRAQVASRGGKVLRHEEAVEGAPRQTPSIE